MARSWMLRALLVAVAMNVVLSATRPMVSYTADDSGASATQVGLIAACYGLLSVFVAAPAGRWIDRWGAPRFIALGVSMMSASALWLVVASDLLTLALTQLLMGTGFILSIIGVQTLLANNGDHTTHDRYFGRLTIANSIGQIVGPLLVAFLVGQLGLGFPAVFAIVGGLAATIVVLALSLWNAEVRRPATEQRRLRMIRAVGEVLKIPSMPHAMAASLAIMATVDVIAVYLPLLGEANGIPVTTVGLLLATSAAATLLSRLLTVPLVRLVGRLRLLILSMVVPAFSLGLVPFVHVTPLLFALMFLTGFGLGVGVPITLAWVAGRAPAHMRGLALGTRLTANRTGQLGVPVIAGVVAGATGVAAVFLTLSTLLGTGAAYVSRSKITDE